MKQHDKEYVVISDVNSKVLLSTPDYYEARKLLNRIAHSGGAASLFKLLPVGRSKAKGGAK